MKKQLSTSFDEVPGRKFRSGTKNLSGVLYMARARTGEGRNFMKISALIPFKSDHGGFRDKNLYYIKKRYETLMPDVELIIGEDASEPFNHSRAVNRAAAKATGDLFMVVDADVFFGTKLIDIIIQNEAFHPWIIPFSQGFKLSPKGSEEVLKSGQIKLPTSFAEVDIESNCNFYGAFMNVMSREAFELVGGQDERFYGWGGEDESFARALDTLAGPHFRLYEPIFHLWHPPVEYYHSYRTKNDELKERYIKNFGNVEAMKELIAERTKVPRHEMTENWM
jgi:hypothetical protein